jgi:cobalt-zinc-cadmium efflux system membrane fusion protein
MNRLDVSFDNLSRVRALPVKSQFAIVAAAALLIVVGLIVAHFVSGRSDPGAVPQPPVQDGSFRPTKAQWDSLQIASVQALPFVSELVTDGTVAYNDDTTTPVFSPYSGRVAKIFAKPGDIVARGAPLLSVDASEFAQGQNDLVAAVDAVNAAKAQVKLAEANEQRQHEMLLAKVGSQKDWLQSQADLTAAKSALRTAEIALGTARSRLRILGKSDEEIRKLETASDLQATKSEAVVHAPLAGTIIQRQVGPGQYIQSGASNPVYQIGDLSTVWVVANVREADAARLKLGAEVEVHALAWPDRVFKAKLAWIAPAIDPVTHRLPVRAEVDNRDGALKPTMFASIRIVTGDAATAPGVPQGAIVYEGADAHVYVARADNTLALRAIRIGRTRGDLVEVADGLTAGERVVTSGALFIDRAAAGEAQ